MEYNFYPYIIIQNVNSYVLQAIIPLSADTDVSIAANLNHD
jgi:hypothetical protein